MMIRKSDLLAGGIVLLSISPVLADPRPTYTLYGTPGLIDMPTAQSAEDGEMAINVSTFRGQVRNTLTFQITPRLSGSFRYSSVDNFGDAGGRLFDRSFDLRFRLMDEGRYLPAVAIGLQDFLGTGVYSGEYLVATKTFADRLTVTGGIGWGRLGSHNSFENPLGGLDARFKIRPINDFGLGGEASFATWFRGPAAVFAGVTYDVNDRLTLKAEYSSDAYTRETTSGLPADRLERKSPVNFGVNYRLRPGIDVAASFVHGSEFALGLTFSFNPRHSPNKGVLGTAPLPLTPRPARVQNPAAWTTEWVADPSRQVALQTGVRKILATDGLELIALNLDGQTAHAHIRNQRHESLAQAIGRSARVLSIALPASVETFKISPVVNGVTPTTVTIKRSDMERLEHAPDNAWTAFTRADFKPGSRLDDPFEDVFPRFSWGISPDLGLSFFDPDLPVRFDLGVLASAQYDLAPGWSVSGALRQSLVGNIDNGRASNSVLPHVRTDAVRYAQASGPVIHDLTLDYFFKPGDTLYGHVSAGYFEQMFGGVSAELLWKPVESRLAFGAEISYVAQRDFDQRLGFQDYEVATGHLSAYYAFNNGFHGRIDVGRYLAGDLGATLALSREFKNGWSVGAFATKTNVSAEDFGEGSFDKGITLTIPLAWTLGQPTRRNLNTVIRSITRDGGARLNIKNRLYGQIREYHKPQLRNQWGRFWR